MPSSSNLIAVRGGQVPLKESCLIRRSGPSCYRLRDHESDRVR